MGAARVWPWLWGLAMAAVVACGGPDEDKAPAPSAPGPASAVTQPGPRPAANGSGGTYTPAPQVPGEIFMASPYDGPRPATFNESPSFAQMVADGTPFTLTSHKGPLPPLQERLPVPEDVLVIGVAEGIGEYGGTWRISLSGWMLDLAQYAYGRCVREASDNVLLVPYTCKDWNQSDDGRVVTYTLRRGVKWSDNSPLDMQSVIFAHEGVNFNREKNPITPARYSDPVTGNRVQLDLVDDWSFSYSFDTPYYTFTEASAQGPFCRGWCLYASDYVKQFVPGYADTNRLEQMVKEADLEDWVSLLKQRLSVHSYSVIDAPHIGPYLQVSGRSNGDGMALKANPYHFAVDPLGNQLPYLDGIKVFGFESRAVAVFRGMGGESDATTVPYSVSELPLYQDNMEKGDYSIYSWPALGGSDALFTVNQTYNDDPEIGRLMRTKEFRIALSLAIDRVAIHDTVFLGLGTPGNAVAHPSTKYFPGEKWVTLDTEFDPDRANAILDSLGLIDTDGDGIRNRVGDLTGRSGNLELFMGVPVGGHVADRLLDLARLVQERWSNVGIKLDWKQDERSYVALRKNILYLGVSGGWGGANPWQGGSAPMTPTESGSYLGPLIGEYFEYFGKRGMGPTGPDPAYLPLAPEGTYPADSTGKLLHMQNIWSEGRSYPDDHPRRIEIGRELYRTAAEEKHAFGIVGFSGNQWGTMITRNNFRNVPKHHAAATLGFFHETYYFEDGVDNFSNPGNRSKQYGSESFLTGLHYN